MGARVDLEELAMRALEYKLAEGADPAAVAESDRVYLTDDYKRRVLEHMSIGQLIDTIMINPTVHLAPSARDTGLVASYQFQPLSNLVYTRDQQVTTCRGVVMARLRSPQRQLEVELMRFALRKLGLPIIGAVEAPGFLEGGDFFPAGRGLALVGVGLRSNVEACQQLMERDLLGTDRLAVVRDEFEQSQVRGREGGGGGGG
jgi:arginine deiminase